MADAAAFARATISVRRQTVSPAAPRAPFAGIPPGASVSPCATAWPFPAIWPFAVWPIAVWPFAAVSPFAAILLALCLGLAGCTSVPAPTQVAVAPGIELALPSPAALGRVEDAQQLVTAHYNGAVFVFETRISVTPSRLLVVGTDMLGRRAMTISWDGSAMRVEVASWVPAALRPQNVLADIILMHWPIGVLRADLNPGAAIETPAPNQRVVTLAGRTMIRMERVSGVPPYWSGQWYYQNLAWGYALDIESVDAAP